MATSMEVNANFSSNVPKLKNRARIADICLRYGVKRLAIFGSAITDEFDESSDVDVAVIFDREGFEGSFDQYMGLKEELEEFFGRSVDLVTANRIRNPIFAREIEQTQRVIYAA